MSTARHLLAATVLLAAPLLGQSRSQVQAYVKEAVAFAQTHSREVFLREVTELTGRFHFHAGKEHGLYLFVYDLKGTVLAHGARPELVGIDRWEAWDPDGKPWVQERTRLVQEKGHGWIEYRESNPAAHNRYMKKQSWVELWDGMVIGAGTYLASE